MSYPNRLLVLALMPILFSCSNHSGSLVRFSGYAYDYTDARITSPLSFPSDVRPLKQDNLYPVPAVASAAAVGQAVSLVPPSLLLAGDDSSSAVKVNDRFQLLLEQPEAELWLLLQQFLASQNIAIEEQDDSQHQLLTDWVIWEDKNFWHKVFGYNGPKAKRERYLIEASSGPSGRNTLLNWEQVARQEIPADQNEWQKVEPNLSDETSLANDFLEFYRSKQPKKLNISSEAQLDIELVQNTTGAPIYLLNQGFQASWELMANIIPALGMKISDKDQSLGTYFVDYQGPESSWKFWKKSEQPELPVAKQSYKIQLGEFGQRTSISILNDKDVSLSLSELQDLWPFMVQAAKRASQPENTHP